MKVSIIGGGGTRAPILVGALLDLQEQLDLTEISIIDPDTERLTAIDKVVSAVVQDRNSAVEISHAGTFRECVAGASFVIAAIRVGGDHMRTLDERIPLSMDILGQETVGAGGFAMAVRTIPVVLEMLRELREVAPDAWFINLTNPSGIITQAMVSHGGFYNVVGICDAPTSIGILLAYLLKVEPENLVLDYYGLNHCGFVKSVYAVGHDVLPRILSMIDQVPDFEVMTHFPPAFVQRLGKLPNGYIWYYAFKRESLAAVKAAGRTRGEEVERLNAQLFADLRTTDDPMGVYDAYLGKREDGHLAEEYRTAMSIKNGQGYSAVAMDVLLGLAGKAQSVVPVNVMNRGAIAGLALDDVVEVPSLITERLIRPLAVGPIDSESRLLIEQVKLYERSLVDAVVYRDLEALIDALAINPLVPSPAVARDLVLAFREQEAPYFDNFN
ncbi:MAG: family 4 glycosyl hydrolase [Candidatus Cryosericum sp.]